MATFLTTKIKFNRLLSMEPHCGSLNEKESHSIHSKLGTIVETIVQLEPNIKLKKNVFMSS